MNVGAEELLGRARVTERLIPECLRRPPQAGMDALPVILLLGPRGSGKTMLLEQVERKCRSVPYVRLDLDGVNHNGSRVVADVAGGLRRKFHDAQGVEFPRFDLCRLSVGQKLDPQDRRRAKDKLQALLHGDTTLSLAVASDLARIGIDLGISAGQLPPGFKAAESLLQSQTAENLFQRVGSLVLGRRLSGLLPSSPGQPSWRWVDDPLARLIDLSWKNLDHLDERGAVEAALFEAFLDDLRAAFQGRHESSRPFNCLALLDNVDSAGGRSFLELLVATRHRAATTEPNNNHDPLVVVATSRSWLLASANNWGDNVRAVEAASRQDWAQERGRRSGSPDSWWYPVALRDLREQEVEQMVSRADLLGCLPNFVKLVHRVTNGHPRTVRIILEATKAGPRSGDMTHWDVLGLPVKNANPIHYTVADQARDEWLRGVDGDLREAMITCSAASEVSPLVVHAALTIRPMSPIESELRTLQGRQLLDSIEDRHWTVDGPGGRSRTLHPLLRRLLLRALAARDDQHPDRWEVIHLGLAQHYQERGSAIEEMHHRLACGALEPAVTLLARTLISGKDALEWLDDLAAITAAPNRLTREFPRQPPIQQVHKLVDDTSVTAEVDLTLAPLVAALWISADPLGDPDGTLSPLIVRHYEDLARLARRGFDSNVLWDAAKKYRK